MFFGQGKEKHDVQLVSESHDTDSCPDNPPQPEWKGRGRGGGVRLGWEQWLVEAKVGDPLVHECAMVLRPVRQHM